MGWLIFAGAVAAVLFITRLGKNAAGQPFVRNPLMPQLVLGYAARILKTGVGFIFLGAGALVLALGIKLNPQDWFDHSKSFPGASAHGTVNVHTGVSGAFITRWGLP